MQMTTLKRIFLWICTSVGALVIVLAVLAAVAGYFLWPQPAGIADKTVLEIDFEKGLEEYTPTDSVASLVSEKKPTVREIILTIQEAAVDDRVSGIVARTGSASLGLATVQEMRDAILAFRSKGKPAVAYAETFGEFGPGNSAYYLATAFDEIYLQPSGDLGLTGIIYSTPFIKETLEKLKIVPRIARREDYKTAVNTFTESEFTPAQRESLTAIMESCFKQIQDGIAEARGLSADQVKVLIDRGPFSSNEALAAKLVDALLYRDEVYASIRKQVGPAVEFMPIRDYWLRIDKDRGDKPLIAMIYGVGSIHRGKSKFSRLSGGVSMGSDTITKAFRAASEDSKVKAILFRIDSPGGSYVASDTIWREITRAKKAGKPVIVSMGDVAASGGYFVAMAADKIVAQPSTLTGSIGVFAGKAVTTEFWKKLGVTWDQVHSSAHSTIWSTTEDYTPQEWEILQRWLDRIYQDFTSKVASSRGLPLEQVLTIAQGRVWTGETAKAFGLVDELGGISKALQVARELAKIPADAEIELQMYPKTKSLLEVIQGRLLDDNDDDAAADEDVVELLTALSTSLPMLHHLFEVYGFLPKPEMLSWPEAAFVTHR